MTTLEGKEACQEVATQQVIRGISEDKWMVIVLVSKDGTVTLEETTCGFPMGDHQTALALIESALEQKVSQVVPQLEELPLAQHLQSEGEADAANS